MSSIVIGCHLKCAIMPRRKILSANIAQGFSVDGQAGDSDEESSFVSKCIYVQGDDEELVGFKMQNMDIGNCGYVRSASILFSATPQIFRPYCTPGVVVDGVIATVSVVVHASFDYVICLHQHKPQWCFGHEKGEHPIAHVRHSAPTCLMLWFLIPSTSRDF